MSQETNLLSQVLVYKGRIVDIIHNLMKFADGETIEYEIVKRPPVVVIIPILESRDIILICEYRASIDKYIWEFPAGTVKQGEQPLEAAKRELEEEVGYKTDKIELLRIFYTAPHFSDEEVYIYLATKLYPGEINIQEKEFITTHFLTEIELKTKYFNAEIVDGKSIVAYQDLIQYRKGSSLEMYML